MASSLCPEVQNPTLYELMPPILKPDTPLSVELDDLTLEGKIDLQFPGVKFTAYYSDGTISRDEIKALYFYLIGCILIYETDEERLKLARTVLKAARQIHSASCLSGATCGDIPFIRDIAQYYAVSSNNLRSYGPKVISKILEQIAIGLYTNVQDVINDGKNRLAMFLL